MIRLFTIAANESRKLSQFRRRRANPQNTTKSSSIAIFSRSRLALSESPSMSSTSTCTATSGTASWAAPIPESLGLIVWIHPPPGACFCRQASPGLLPLLSYCHFLVLYQMTVLSFRCVLSICVQLLRRPLFIYYTTRADAAETLRLSADIRAPRDSSRENVKG